MCNPKGKVAHLFDTAMWEKNASCSNGDCYTVDGMDTRLFITNESLTLAEMREYLQRASMWKINNDSTDERGDRMILT
jgi:hypothetical protein